MPDFTNYSKSDLETILKFLNVNPKISGHGYVLAQSVPPGTKIEDNMTIEFVLGNKLSQ